MPDPEANLQGQSDEAVESPEQFMRETAGPGEGEAGEQTPEGDEGRTQATKYGGKSPEEMAALLAEKDRVIAQAYEESAKAKHEVGFYKTLAEQGPTMVQGQGLTPGYPGGFPAPAPGEPMPYGYGHLANRPPQFPPFDPKKVVTEEEYLADPIQATYKLQVARQQYDQYVAQQTGQWQDRRAAEKNYVDGRTEAFKKTPALFKGVEGKVSAWLREAYESGQVTATQLRDAKTWQVTAELVRREDGETDFGKYYKAPPKGMPAGHQEVPTSGPAAKGRVQLSAEQKELVKMWGMPEDQFLKAYEKEIGG